MNLKSAAILSFIFFKCISAFIQETNCVDCINNDSSIYSYEDLVLSTLDRTGSVSVQRPDATVLHSLSVPVENPIYVSFDGTLIPISKIVRANGDLNKVLTNIGVILTSAKPLQSVYSHPGVNNQHLLQLQGRASRERSFYITSQRDMSSGYGRASERHLVSTTAPENATPVTFRISATATLDNPLHQLFSRRIFRSYLASIYSYRIFDKPIALLALLPMESLKLPCYGSSLNS